MRFTSLSVGLLCVIPALGFKFKAKVPHKEDGTPLSHQLPKLNIPLTLPGGIKLDVDADTPQPGKVKVSKMRRQTKEYVPTLQELNELAQSFQSVLPPEAKKNPEPVKLNGAVAVFSAQQGFMGYIRLALSQYATTGLTSDTSKAAFLRLPSSSPKAPFDLGIYNASEPYLAVIQGYSGSNWGRNNGNPGYGSMTVVQHSTFPASNTNNPTFLPSESAIWSLSSSPANLLAGHELSATWYNDNGAPVQCTIYFDVTYGDFGFTGDLNAYVKLYLDNTVAVTLYFIPLW